MGAIPNDANPDNSNSTIATNTEDNANGQNNLNGLNPNENVEKYIEPKLIWIDKNVNEGENIYNQERLGNIISPIKVFNSLEDGLKEIKKIKLKKIILILTARMFDDFIKIFEEEKKNIFCCLNIIIFTREERIPKIEEICNKSKIISSGYLFNKTNIFFDIVKILDFIKKENEKRKTYTQQFETIDETNRIYYDENIDNFEKIRNFEELILPIYFHRSIAPITFEEIHNFNYYLLTSFGKENEKIKDIISQFENIPEMTNEIICKYWAYVYTLEKGKFYQVLNSGLRKKKYKLFLPFIKMMYEGIKNSVFPTINNEKLYSGGIISNNELEKLRKNLEMNNNNINIESNNDIIPNYANNYCSLSIDGEISINKNINNNNKCLYQKNTGNISNDNNLPKVIYYIRAFKSFSKAKKKAETFISKSTTDSTGLLFVILTDDKNEIEDKFMSNAYIKEFSEYKHEEEVLFFPFSSFEVVKIKDKEEENGNKYVKIYLRYLGRYKSFIEEKKSKQTILNDVPISQFGRDISEMGLIKYKFSKYWRVKEEITLKENVSCLLIFGNDKLLIPINNKLILLDIKNDKILISSIISDSRINDLLKINENEFICSSGDGTIKFVQITIDFSGFIILKNIKIHSKEIIQTIKLKEDKLFASCSKDLSIKIWECDFKNRNSKELIRNTINSSIEVLSIFELPNGEIIYISKNGRLVFLELKNGEYFLIEAINGIKNGLHNSIFLVNNDTILVGTKRNVFLIDINKRKKIKSFALNYSSNSIRYVDGNIFLGVKQNIFSCVLFQYIIDKKNGQINLECIGKGRDLCHNISFIDSLGQKFLVTCIKENFIKIWEEIEEKPNLLLVENNPDYEFEDGYESEKENDNIYMDKKFNMTMNSDNYNFLKDNKNSIQYNNYDDNLGYFTKYNMNQKTKKYKNEEKKPELIYTNMKKIKSLDENPGKDSEKDINITFRFLEGGIILSLPFDKEMTVEQLIQSFLDKQNKDNKSSNMYAFLFGGKILEIDDQTKIKDKFVNNSIILVLKKN